MQAGFKEMQSKVLQIINEESQDTRENAEPDDRVIAEIERTSALYFQTVKKTPAAEVRKSGKKNFKLLKQIEPKGAKFPKKLVIMGTVYAECSKGSKRVKNWALNMFFYVPVDGVQKRILHISVLGSLGEIHSKISNVIVKNLNDPRMADYHDVLRGYQKAINYRDQTENLASRLGSGRIGAFIKSKTTQGNPEKG